MGLFYDIFNLPVLWKSVSLVSLSLCLSTFLSLDFCPFSTLSFPSLFFLFSEKSFDKVNFVMMYFSNTNKKKTQKS